MKPLQRMAAISTAFFLLAAGRGCATGPQATRPAPSEITVQIPPAAVATVDVRSSTALPPPELPLSVADESRGRWLTLFELNYSPVHPPRSVGEEEP